MVKIAPQSKGGRIRYCVDKKKPRDMGKKSIPFSDHQKRSTFSRSFLNLFIKCLPPQELLKQLEATYRIAAILECPEYISHWSRLINQCLQPSESVFRSAVTLPKLPEGTETEVCDKLLKLFEVDRESVMEKFHQIGKGISDKGLSYLCTFGFCLTAHQQAKITAVLTSRSKDLLVGGSMTRSALSQNKIDTSDLMKDLCITR